MFGIPGHVGGDAAKVALFLRLLHCDFAITVVPPNMAYCRDNEVRQLTEPLDIPCQLGHLVILAQFLLLRVFPYFGLRIDPFQLSQPQSALSSRRSRTLIRALNFLTAPPSRCLSHSFWWTRHYGGEEILLLARKAAYPAPSS